MKLKLSENQKLICLSFNYDKDVVRKIKSIPGSYWKPARKYWVFPNNYSNLALLLEMFKDDYVFFQSKVKDFAGPELITAYFNHYFLPQFEKN